MEREIQFLKKELERREHQIKEMNRLSARSGFHCESIKEEVSGEIKMLKSIMKLIRKSNKD